MNSKFKKIIPLIVVFCVFTILVMSGCQSIPAPPDEEAISEYLPSILTDPYVNDAPLNLPLSNVEIEKRQTNEKDDHVYFHYEMSDGDYILTGGYYFYYVYYDEGGWILENTSEYGATELRYTGSDFPDWPMSVDLLPFEWVLEQVAALKYDSIEEVDCKKIDDRTFQFTYNVQKKVSDCNYSGNVKVNYTLQESGCLDFDWVSEVDSSEITRTMDIVGTYAG